MGSRRGLLGGAGRLARRRIGIAASSAGGGVLGAILLSRNAQPGVAAGGSCRLMMAAIPFPIPRSTTMSKKTTKKATKSKAASKFAKQSKAKKVGALDTAAQVLSGSKEPMDCKDLIEAMAKKGLWTSPGGKTPHATLYSAIIREIEHKGKESRFAKKDRGQFAAA
jgi:HB1, ASXL, restriction endonuclease HTH domain